MEAPLAFQAMNTDFLVAGVAAAHIGEVRRMVEEAETMFSRFAPDSEISRINGNPGEWTPVSLLTCDLLSDTIAAFQATDGLFNPFMARTMKALGYDRSFELLQPGVAKTADGLWGCEKAEKLASDPFQTVDLLPLELESLRGDLSDTSIVRDENLKYEPTPEAVFRVLIPKYIKGMLYSLFVEAFTSEQSSRMTAMDSATSNADDMLQKLHLYYNRARQAAITQEISEIVGGADALK